MRIKWYGQAAFGITGADGRRIVCDPYTPEELGYAPIQDAADIVLTSSDNDSAHCRHDLVPGDHEWLNCLDAVRAGGFVLSLEEVMRVIGKTKPKLVIPMHFRTLTYKPRSMEWIEAFLRLWDEEKDVDFACGCEVDLTKENLPDATRVLVMDYAR